MPTKVEELWFRTPRLKAELQLFNNARLKDGRRRVGQIHDSAKIWHMEAGSWNAKVGGFS